MATHVNCEDPRYANTASARTCEMIVALGDWRGEAARRGHRALPAHPGNHEQSHKLVGEKGTLMEPRISIITLGVSDLPRAVEFYRDGLGYLFLTKTPNPSRSSRTGAPGCPVPSRITGRRRRHRHRGRWILRRHSGPQRPHQGGGGRLLDVAVNAGATLVKPAQDTFWGGYSGYFADPGGLPLGDSLESSLLDRVGGERPGLRLADHVPQSPLNLDRVNPAKCQTEWAFCQ